MKTSDFDYDLPEELIAQEPAAERDGCRLLVMDRATGELEDRIFRDIVDYLRPNDLLVVNETRVMPARLLGAKRGTGGAAEVFLLREVHGGEVVVEIRGLHACVLRALRDGQGEPLIIDLDTSRRTLIRPTPSRTSIPRTAPARA